MSAVVAVVCVVGEVVADETEVELKLAYAAKHDVSFPSTTEKTVEFSEVPVESLIFPTR